MNQVTDKIREHTLQAFRNKCSAVISKQLIRDLQVRDLEDISGDVAEHLLVELDFWLYGERFSHTLCLTVPTSWWQHFKEELFPERLKRIFPVRFKQMRQTVYAARLFPEFVPPRVGEPVAKIIEFSPRGWSQA